MDRRVFLASSISALSAPSLALGTTEVLRIYYPFVRSHPTWASFAANVEAIINENLSSSFTVQSKFFGEMDIPARGIASGPRYAVQENLCDLALVTNEAHLGSLGNSGPRGLAFNSELMLDHSITSVDAMDSYLSDASAWEHFDHITFASRINVKPIGTIGSMGLGWFQSDIESAFQEALNAQQFKAAAPVMMTGYGWSRFWNNAGFMPLILNEGQQYRTKEDCSLDGQDLFGQEYDWLATAGDTETEPECRNIVGAQIVNELTADVMGALELWSQYIPSEISGAPSIQFMAARKGYAFDEIALFARIFRDALSETRTEVGTLSRERKARFPDARVVIAEDLPSIDRNYLVNTAVKEALRISKNRTRELANARGLETREFFQARADYYS
jgi:hypothetical protein